MAFITVEDRLGEIEVIVFAKQYAKFSTEIFEENAVLITGNLSIDETDGAKIILSDISPLISNGDYKSKPEREMTLYIKVTGLDDKRIATISRMALLNPGKCSVVLYDTTTKKYSAIKNVRIDPSDKVLARFKTNFGEDSVVLK